MRSRGGEPEYPGQPELPGSGLVPRPTPSTYNSQPLLQPSTLNSPARITKFSAHPIGNQSLAEEKLRVGG